LLQNDPAEKKINLGVGAYRDDNGKPFVLPSVREAEKRILERNVDHEYAPIQGNDLFISLSEKFVFGEESQVLKVTSSSYLCSISSATGQQGRHHPMPLRNWILENLFGGLCNGQRPWCQNLSPLPHMGQPHEYFPSWWPHSRDV
jgi:hypothetical protein